MKEVLKTVTASSIATLSNGADLFGFLDQTHFDLLFLDASLTDKNGSALVKHLPCLVKNVTVAVTDTRVNPHEMKKMFHGGARSHSKSPLYFTSFE
ncbi:MAG: response regulator [Bacteroidetes bacterium]|nr:MAG: response regulator [Bacteroidota bacterium]